MVDQKFMEHVINCCLPFPVVLKQATGNRYDYSRKCFCPFHNNFDTPAAKIFHNEDGDYLFCFSEQRQYRPSDVFDKKLIKTSLATVYYKLWDKLEASLQTELKLSFGKDVDALPENWEQYSQDLARFMLGETSYQQHLSYLIKALI